MPSNTHLLRCACFQQVILPERPESPAKHHIVSNASKPAELHKTGLVPSAPLNALDEVRAAALEVMGTDIDIDAPLMSAGLDSIAVIELVSTLSKRLGIEIQQTALFDHPTLDSLASFISSELGTNEKTEMSQEEQLVTAQVPILSTKEDRNITIAACDLYSELKQEKTDELFVPPAAKSARRAVVLLALAGSGSKHILSTLRGHQHLCVCEDLCLVPFKTVVERNEALSSRSVDLQDGLDNAVKTLRNCKMPDICHLFGTVANTYRAMQEWCAPQILVDGTDAYSVLLERSVIEAKNVFLDPDFVHLLRNPRQCLGDARGSGDIIKLEK